MSELKPCPFCGSEAGITQIFNSSKLCVYYNGTIQEFNSSKLSFYCNKCGSSLGPFDTSHEAIDEWNRRNNHE